MKPTVFVTLLLVCSCFKGFSQFGESQTESSLKLQNRTLLVVYQEFKSKNALNFNTFIESALKERWTFNTDIKFVNTNEFLLYKMNPSKNKKYAYLKYSTYYMVNDYPAGCLILGLAEEAGVTHFQHVAPFGDQALNKADLIFALDALQQRLRYSVANKEAVKQLDIKLKEPQTTDFANKTLLIDQNLIASALPTNINAHFKYPFKLVSKTKIDDAILNHDDRFLFIRALPITKAPKRNKDYSNETGVQIIDTNIYFSKTYETKIEKSEVAFINLIMQAKDGAILYMGEINEGDDQIDLSFFKALSKHLN